MRYKVLFIVVFITTFTTSQTKYVDAIYKKVNTKTYIYAIKDKNTLKLDLYQPINDTLKLKPLFVIIHGGGFTTGAKNDKSLVLLAKETAKKGYVVASIDYRLLDKQTNFNCSLPIDDALKVYAKSEEDVLEAITYLLKDPFKIDASKIILFGTSAGAETLLNVSYKNSEKFKNIKIAGVISISGAMLNSNLIEKETAIPGAYYHGTEDKVIPYYHGAHHYCSELNTGYFLMDGSRKIVEKLESLETSFLFYGYKNRGHDIFNLPKEDFKDAFMFIKKVVFDDYFYQVKMIK